MSPEETAGGRGAGVLGALLAPLRLPERAIDALASLAEQVQELTAISTELTRVREHTEPLAQLLPALRRLERGLGARIDSLRDVVVALEANDSHLNRTTAELAQELGAMHETIRGLKADLGQITDRLPDPNAPGPLAKARDALTGGDS